MIDMGMSINGVGIMGDTPLHVCAIHDSKRMTDLLLSFKASPSQEDNEGWSPLHFAARFGNLKVLEALRKSHFSSVCSDSRGGGHPKDPLTKDDWTPLHVASRFEQKEAVTYLLSASADKEAKDNQGHTALHVACRHGLFEMAKHLLNHRLEVDAKTFDGESPGHLALKFGHRHTLELLLNSGLNIEARDNNGETLLHYSARGEGSQAIEMLCQRGAHLQAKNNKGWCALHIAAETGNLDAIRCLITSGCDIDVRDNEGGSWLFLLHKTHYNDVTKFLVAANSRTEAEAEGPRMVLRDTALIYTQEPEEPIKNLSCERHFNMIKFVSEIAAGTNFDQSSQDSLDLLHYACEYGHTELISFLIHQGTDLHARDADGLNVMSIGAKHGDVGVIRLLTGELWPTSRSPLRRTALHKLHFVSLPSAPIFSCDKNTPAPDSLAPGNKTTGRFPSTARDIALG